MLKPYSCQYWTNSTNPTAYHLGDLVNIYQQAAHLGDCTLYSKAICPCCGNNSEEVLKFLTELNPAVKYGRLSGKPQVKTPWWFKDHSGGTCEYVKALKLPKRGKHVAFQIDSRSRGQKVPGWMGRGLQIIKNGINVGDRRIKGKNATKATLREKFEIIASARYYVGIDSGLTHLALMTDTPIILVHPREWDVSRFYPDTPQITKVADYKAFVKLHDRN